MMETDQLADQFEGHRARLTAVAYRMLGSLAEAEDAVQETWLRLSRADTSEIANLGGWLTTTVARICLDMLRARASRSEDSIDASNESGTARVTHRVDAPDAQQEAELAESVGLAMMVVLEALSPPERVAFVLHDMFDVPFDDIARAMDRSSDSVRQLASRARRRVRGAPLPPSEFANRRRQHEVVDAYLAASRAGDFEALMAVLDPDVVLRVDATALSIAGAAGVAESRGAAEVARRALAAPGRARAARPIIVADHVGVVVAPFGRLLLVLDFTIEHGRVKTIEAIGDSARLTTLELLVA